MRYVTTVSPNGIQFDVGSDWHLPPDNTDLLKGFAKRVASEQGSSILVLAGDVIETSDGLNSASLICSLLADLSKVYRGVIFAPGNHDLRGRENPWGDFADLPSNVACHSKPIGSTLFSLKALDMGMPDACVMLTNIFYDMMFMDPTLLGLTNEILMKQYAESNDGLHFLKGDTKLFVEMAARARGCLSVASDQVDILVTHALPHPCQVTFRVAEMTDDVRALSEKLGIPFVCDTAYDEKSAKRWDTTPEGFRAWWNNKSFFMGSDILSTTDFKNGLVAVYGHNHRSNNKPTTINGKTVHFVSHQPNPWETKYV